MLQNKIVQNCYVWANEGPIWLYYPAWLHTHNCKTIPWLVTQMKPPWKFQRHLKGIKNQRTETNVSDSWGTVSCLPKNTKNKQCSQGNRRANRNCPGHVKTTRHAEGGRGIHTTMRHTNGWDREFPFGEIPEFPFGEIPEFPWIFEGFWGIPLISKFRTFLGNTF